mgnify:CR=1 FL=1
MVGGLFIGCATQTQYNTPFINVDDTIELEFGLSQDEVLKRLNEPLYVSNGDQDTIIWVYEVRTIEVKSKVLYSSKIIPQKKANNPEDKRHADPIHKLSLTFINGELASWKTDDQ